MCVCVRDREWGGDTWMIVKTVEWMRMGGGRKRPERVRATGARMIVFERCCLPFPM